MVIVVDHSACVVFAMLFIVDDFHVCIWNGHLSSGASAL